VVQGTLVLLIIATLTGGGLSGDRPLVLQAVVYGKRDERLDFSRRTDYADLVSTQILCLSVADARVRGWLDDSGIDLEPDWDHARLPTADEVRTEIHALHPAAISKVGAAVWDVNFGPVAGSGPEAPHYEGGGFELTRDADSISFRGGAVEHIHALTTAWSRICGPLVLVHASAGTPVVMRPEMGLAELVARLEG
jgi:hypothetical protein